MKNIVVFASGSGSNFQSIIDAVQRGDLVANINGLITDRPHIGAIQKAEKQNIPVQVISPDSCTASEFEQKLLQQLAEWNTDLIVLAGYLKKIPLGVIQRYSNRILNIHPSLLPKFGGKGFYGLRVHQSVLDAGENKSGCTVHVVTEEFDQGPILAQISVPVFENDSPQQLAKRVLEQEHKLYPKIIQDHLQSL